MKNIIFCLMLAVSSFVHADEVRLLTWNVFMLPKPIKFSLQAERTPLIIKQLKNSQYDVIVLQEAFAKSFREQLKTHLFPKFPFHHYLGRKIGSLTVYGSGVYLLSKFPIVSTEHVYYSECAKADCFASKGTLLATLRLPSGKHFQIAGTHLQAGRKNFNIRTRQLQQVKNLMKENAKPDQPLVYVGDMNIDALKGTEFDSALQLLGMSSAKLEGPLNYTGGYPIECYRKPGANAKKWIDHVWTQAGSSLKITSLKVRPYLEIIYEKECPLSDHYGVEAVLTL